MLKNIQKILNPLMWSTLFAELETPEDLLSLELSEDMQIFLQENYDSLIQEIDFEVPPPSEVHSQDSSVIMISSEKSTDDDDCYILPSQISSRQNTNKILSQEKTLPLKKQQVVPIPDSQESMFPHRDAMDRKTTPLTTPEHEIIRNSNTLCNDQRELLCEH